MMLATSRSFGDRNFKESWEGVAMAMEAAMQDEEPPRPQHLLGRLDDEADYGQQASGSGASVAAVDAGSWL